MKEDKLKEQILMKLEMELALNRFKTIYKKIPKGIVKIYNDCILSKKFSLIKKQYSKFFQHIKQSKFYKDLNDEK